MFLSGRYFTPVPNVSHRCMVSLIALSLVWANPIPLSTLTCERPGASRGSMN